MRKLRESYYEKYSAFFPVWPTMEKGPLHKWMPTTMDQAKAVELAEEEEKADHKVVKVKEKEAKEVAKEAVEARAVEEAMWCSMGLMYWIPTARFPAKNGINLKVNITISGIRGTRRTTPRQQVGDEGKVEKPQICRQGQFKLCSRQP